MPFKLFLSDEKYTELEDILKPIEDELQMERFKLEEHSYDDILVVLGGDGTLNYLAQLDFQIPPKVIYFPRGTANDFAKCLGFSHNQLTAKTIKEIATHSQCVEVPLMTCNEHFFINIATGGAPATVTNAGSDMLKKITGKMSYYLAAIDQFMAPHEYSISYQSSNDSASEINIYGFTISQGIFAGGGVKVSNSSVAMFKDKFNIVISPAKPLKDVISDIILLQSYKESEYKTFKTTNSDYFKIKSLDNRSISLKLDGEEYEAKELEFQKSHKKINFYIY